MNELDDFTKEELGTIKDMIHAYISYPLLPKYLPLLKKIQGKISNYCEHTKTYTDYDCNPERCNKCMAIFDE